MEEGTIGIAETKEVFSSLINILERAAKAKADDGKINVAEAIAMAIQSAPEVVKAVIGADQIKAEMKDLDKAEVEEIAILGVQLANAAMALVAGA